MASKSAMIAHAIKMMREREIENVNKMNKEIDKCKMAYKIEDSEGNRFVFVGIENGCPLYRVNGQLTHVMDLTGCKIIEKYRSLEA